MKQLEMLKKAMAGKGLPYGWTYCFNEQCVVKEEWAHPINQGD